ncbi:S8 family serine peptidase [Luteimonas sp. RD2P54]|uniref:S8 family serine peptidase n=1 Tax=Luteimonas endophytica TaxID=3042023 RepID=A0ABT6JF53_9GAMM|nr:autotransporter serine protease [Luteimonas endophytica]MDH5824813.1 S8 family serine peptidase [Luteimonas endophytica]
MTGRRPCARAMLTAALAVALAACGGGGGGDNVRPDPATPPTTPPPPPPPPPEPPPPPAPPPTPQPAVDAHLALTNARDAHDAGYSGAGYRIGVIDTGINRDHPALVGRVIANLTYVGQDNDLGVDDVVGHGTTVAQIAAGAAVGEWPGGIAPGAELLSARIINDEPPEDDGSGQGNEVDGPLGLLPIHEDLIDRGMRIMNNSWGGLYWTDPAATDPIASEYRSFVHDHDGLVVFATGNESGADPSDTAALPSQPGPGGTRPAADLERGWLAVAALDTANPTELADYSNACGIAMSYCLVAPGTVMFTAHDATTGDPDLWYGSGTSFAAPQVAGAAALVWEAFPYFDNDLVRQTLLGTAADLGDPGPDAVFGYGLLDVGKAVLGPARFDWGDVTVNLQGHMGSMWQNSISGAGGLIVDGNGQPGNLSLEGENTYTGTTRVRGQAVLAVRNSLTSPIHVEPTGSVQVFGGQLQGNVLNQGSLSFGHGGGAQTTFRGDIRNEGFVMVGRYPNARFKGDYIQIGGGVLSIYLGADPLHFEGQATLAGNLDINGVVSGYVARSSTEVLIADGGVSGEFSTMTWNPSLVLVATFGYGTDRVWLDVERADVAATAGGLAGMTVSSLDSAVRLENAFRRIDAQLPGEGADDLPADNGLIRAAGQIQQVQTASAFTTMLDSLSGKAHAAASAMTFDSIDLNRRALSSRFGELAGRPAAGGEWTQALGGAGSGSFAGGDYQMDGWMLGNDYRLGGSGVAGLAFGQTRADSAVPGAAERGRDRQAQGQVYGGWLHGNGYAMGQLGVGRYDRRIDRQLLLGGDRSAVQADYAGTFASAGLEAGYRFGLGATSLTPYAGAEHARVESDGFHERGASGFGLRTGAIASSRTQAIAGLRAAHAWRGLDLRGYAEWQHTLSADGLEVDASFVGVDAWSPLAGLQPARSGGLAGVAVDAWLSRDASLSFGYDQRFGPRGDARAVSLRYALGF